MLKHQFTFTVTNYPQSSFAEKITWKCTCGKHGAVRDNGFSAPTRAKASKAARAHTGRV